MLPLPSIKNEPHYFNQTEIAFRESACLPDWQRERSGATICLGKTVITNRGSFWRLTCSSKGCDLAFWLKLYGRLLQGTTTWLGLKLFWQHEAQLQWHAIYFIQKDIAYSGSLCGLWCFSCQMSDHQVEGNHLFCAFICTCVEGRLNLNLFLYIMWCRPKVKISDPFHQPKNKPTSLFWWRRSKWICADEETTAPSLQ